MNINGLSITDPNSKGTAPNKVDGGGHGDTDDYTLTTMDLMSRTVDFRKVVNKDRKTKVRPFVSPGTLYTDAKFTLERALGKDAKGIEWKRPWQFVKDPKLFVDGATRFDVGQGSAGTCWFLSIAGIIAENDVLLQRVLPSKSSYLIEDRRGYDGVFHARFFLFGKWTDVYTDDYLPVIQGKRPWGAHSATDREEMWVSLLEKAFARLHGSYEDINGGKACDAYQLLTGGIGEPLEIKDYKNTPDDFFSRVRNALNSGSKLTCSVPLDRQLHGLVGGHTYSLVGTTEVGENKLVRVRNPWACGEWDGPWSDGSDEWETIPDKVLPNSDDGEFYMSLEDFMAFFNRITICSITPDFDCDGCSDNLDHVLNIYGEWKQDCCGGFQNILKNPRYCFEITDKDILEDGTVPLVLQIIQRTFTRKTDLCDIRCDIYEVLGERIRPSSRCIAMELQGQMGNTVTYTHGMCVSFRHMLLPGRYILIPSTRKCGFDKEFLLRCYSVAPLLNVTEIPQDVNLVLCAEDSQININNKEEELSYEKISFGNFAAHKNAGGQVSHRESFHFNPQYLINVPDGGSSVMVVIHVRTVNTAPEYPIGIRLFNLEQGLKPPVDGDYLYKHYNTSPCNEESTQSKFLMANNLDVRYVLKPGRYVALLHLDKPNTEKEFCIIFRSNTKLVIKGQQTGMTSNGTKK